MSIELHSPHLKLDRMVVAECGFGCVSSDGKKERSFPKNVKGGFFFGGAGRNNPDDDDDASLTTAVIDCRTEDGVCVFETKPMLRGNR